MSSRRQKQIHMPSYRYRTECLVPQSLGIQRNDGAYILLNYTFCLFLFPEDFFSWLNTTQQFF